jgi:hypothetical protein
MANLLQQPNEWNLAYLPNVFTVDDLGTADQFYLAIEINGSNVASFRQPANSSGVAHFDVSKVLQSYMEPQFYETTSYVTDTPLESLSYRVQYGTITNNTIDLGLGYSTFKYVINGYDNWRTLNWNDDNFQFVGQLQACEGPGNTLGRIDGGEFLTNYPKDSYPLRTNSYHTLSFFNRLENWGDGTLWPGTVIQPAYAVIKFRTDQGALIQTSIYSIDANNGLGPRANYDSSTIGNYTDDQLIGTIGVGPQNLKDAGIWPNGGVIPAQVWNQVTQVFGSNTNIWNLGGSVGALVASYSVEIYSVDWCYWEANGAPSDSQASTLSNYLGELIYTYNFHVDEPCSPFDVVTVSFINQYGVKDYVTFDRRNTYTVNSQRNNYTQSQGSWDSTNFAINQHGGGKRTFSTNIQTDVAVSTNWMTDAESKWLEELFTSPAVQVYIDGQWEPCVIGSNTYEQKTFARDKMFQHTLMLTYSNNKRVQRG